MPTGHFDDERRVEQVLDAFRNRGSAPENPFLRRGFGRVPRMLRFDFSTFCSIEMSLAQVSIHNFELDCLPFFVATKSVFFLFKHGIRPTSNVSRGRCTATANPAYGPSPTNYLGNVVE